MKKLLLPFCMFVLIKPIVSQVVFCPPGAEWNFLFANFITGGPPFYMNEKVVYEKDSVIGFDTVKVLRHNRAFAFLNNANNPHTFIKQKGDTVFMRSLATANTWQILYNFAATTGQSWTTTVSAINNFSTKLTYIITVDSVAQVSINNVTLKRLYVKYSKSGALWGYQFESTYITERFGCQRFLFNYGNPGAYSDGTDALYCLCYRDSILGLKQFSSNPCDFRSYQSITKNGFINESIVIFPNPSSSLIQVENQNDNWPENTVLSIHDFSGRLVKLTSLMPTDSGQIPVSEISDGLYSIHIETDGKPIYSGKFVKQR